GLCGPVGVAHADEPEPGAAKLGGGGPGELGTRLLRPPAQPQAGGARAVFRQRRGAARRRDPARLAGRRPVPHGARARRATRRDAPDAGCRRRVVQDREAPVRHRHGARALAATGTLGGRAGERQPRCADAGAGPGRERTGAAPWRADARRSAPGRAARRANVDVATLGKDVGVAQYEKTIQTAFREGADGLAARGTFDEQLAAQERYTATQQRSLELSQFRYRNGVDSYLQVLTAQT